jgi:phosphorylcholine metabolism protein LicD
MAGGKKTRAELHFLFRVILQFFEKADIPFILFYGSLLGYTRDGKLIDQDDDVDVLMHRHDVDRFRAMMDSTGDTNIQYGIQDDHILQLYYGEVGPFDVYIIDVDVEGNVQVPWEKKVFHANDMFPLKPVTFLGCTVYVPNNSIAILEQEYGPYWRIPMAKNQTDPNVCPYIENYETFPENSNGDSFSNLSLLILVVVLFLIIVR